MSIDLAQIEHISRLARLDLSPAEKNKFTTELGDILDYFTKLKELATSHIPISSQSIAMSNVSRPDEIKGCDEATQKNILSAVPQLSGRYLKTGKII